MDKTEKSNKNKNQYIKKDKKAKKGLSTSKILIIFLFLNCTLIELFTGFVTVANLKLAYDIGTSLDFTPLTTLIGAIVGEVIGYAIYALKSAKENSKDGITYELAMQELSSNKGSEDEE